VGNKSTYFLEWEFYVDRNELAWLTDSLGITKFENEPKPAPPISTTGAATRCRLPS
jgi:hypothetical protein